DHVVQVDAVDHEIDRVLTVAGCIEGERTLPAQRRSQEAVLRRCDRAGDEQPEVNEMTAVEWNLLHRALIDHLADGRRRVFDDGTFGNHADRLADAPDLELEI